MWWLLLLHSDTPLVLSGVPCLSCSLGCVPASSCLSSRSSLSCPFLHLSHSVAESWPNTFWHQLRAHSHILNCLSTAHPPDVSGRSIVFFFWKTHENKVYIIVKRCVSDQCVRQSLKSWSLSFLPALCRCCGCGSRGTTPCTGCVCDIFLMFFFPSANAVFASHLRVPPMHQVHHGMVWYSLNCFKFSAAGAKAYSVVLNHNR